MRVSKYLFLLFLSFSVWAEDYGIEKEEIVDESSKSTLSSDGPNDLITLSVERWDRTINPYYRDPDSAISIDFVNYFNGSQGVYFRGGLSRRTVSEYYNYGYGFWYPSYDITRIYYGIGMDISLAPGLRFVPEFLLSNNTFSSGSDSVSFSDFDFNQTNLGLIKRFSDFELAVFQENYGGDLSGASDGMVLRFAAISGIGIEISNARKRDIIKLLYRFEW